MMAKTKMHFEERERMTRNVEKKKDEINLKMEKVELNLHKKKSNVWTNILK